MNEDCIERIHPIESSANSNLSVGASSAYFRWFPGCILSNRCFGLLCEFRQRSGGAMLSTVTMLWPGVPSQAWQYPSSRFPLSVVAPSGQLLREQ
jgi:hypothetical protein